MGGDVSSFDAEREGYDAGQIREIENPIRDGQTLQ